MRISARCITAVFLVVVGCRTTASSLGARNLLGGACLTDGNPARRVLDGPNGQSAGITLVTDPAVCRRAALAYPGRPAPNMLYDVAVARLPNGDFYVFAPADGTMGGEFRCDTAELDANFHLKAHLCG